MTIKRKFIITLSIIASISIGMNVYFIHNYFTTKKEVKHIVTEKIDNITDDLVSKNDKIQEEHDKTIKDMNDVFSNIKENVENTVVETKLDTGEKYVTIKVIDEEYEMLLLDDIETSHQQITFLANQLNDLTVRYESLNNERNGLINELKQQLEQTKKDLIGDITETMVSSNLSKKVRFGIEVYFTASKPLFNTDLSSTNALNTRFSSGISLNTLVNQKLLVKTGIGLSKGNNGLYTDPQVLLGIGWFF